MRHPDRDMIAQMRKQHWARKEAQREALEALIAGNAPTRFNPIETKEIETMANPTCDNDCTRMGWQEAIIETGLYSLHISHPMDADLDGSFRAFCHDEQEMLTISGWLMSDYTLIEKGRAVA